MVLVDLADLAQLTWLIVLGSGLGWAIGLLIRPPCDPIAVVVAGPRVVVVVAAMFGYGDCHGVWAALIDDFDHCPYCPGLLRPVLH